MKRMRSQKAIENPSSGSSGYGTLANPAPSKRRQLEERSEPTLVRAGSDQG
ncbi:hypothetical protein HY26_04635 [Hyphomonas sp. GM-8P]|nr:hypothetical protein HY26_04635 [Hyphomonas sp. GM-8P]